MKRYRQWAVRTLAAMAVLLAGIMLLNFIVDPLQQYRRASFYRPYYHKPLYLNPGLAKTCDYDTVIVGSSMTQNFRSSQVDRVLGGRSIKLHLSGATAYEENLILSTALQAGKARRVIFCLDVFSFTGAPQRFNLETGAMPIYLYDESLLNDYRYLLNIDVLLFDFDILSANLFGSHPRRLDPDMYGYWGQKAFGRELVLQGWRGGSFNVIEEPAGHNSEVPKGHSFEALKASFDFNLLPHIAGHPEVEFLLFYPPYTALAWVDSQRKGVLDSYLAFKRYVFEVLRSYDNVKIFDFQEEQEITCNLDNYRDLTHYAPRVNDFIIEAMSRGEYRVTEENVGEKLRRLKKLAMEFKVPG